MCGGKIEFSDADNRPYQVVVGEDEPPRAFDATAQVADAPMCGLRDEQTAGAE
jgi:hypothetical protein